MDLLRLISILLFHCVRVGRFFGIPVRVHWSFWVLPIGIGIAGLPHGPAFAGIMTLLTLVFYGQGVVLHEYGHALSARLFGVRTRDIILTPIGGVARMEQMPEEPVHEIIIALAGPAVNVFFAIGMLAVLLTGGHHPLQLLVDVGQQAQFTSAAEVLAILMISNVAMVCLNMLPAFPSDGGRVFRAVLSLFLTRLTATRVAVYAGAIVALGIAYVGIVTQKPQLPVIALLFAFIGQMELMMVRRQAQERQRPYARPVWRTLEGDIGLEPPELDFSGYAWDDRGAAWVEWRNGIAVRVCQMRIG